MHSKEDALRFLLPSNSIRNTSCICHKIKAAFYDFYQIYLFQQVYLKYLLDGGERVAEDRDEIVFLQGVHGVKLLRAELHEELVVELKGEGERILEPRETERDKIEFILKKEM